MQNLRIFLAIGLVSWMPLNALAADGTVVGLVYWSFPSVLCLTPTAQTAGTLNFLIRYDNTQPGGPTRFKIALVRSDNQVVNAKLVIPISPSVYHDGILDVSQFSMKGSLGGTTNISGIDACIASRKAAKEDFRVELISAD